MNSTKSCQFLIRRSAPSAYWLLGLLVVCGSAGCGADSRPLVIANADNVKVIRAEFEARGGAAEEKVNPLADANRVPQWATITGRFQIKGSPPSRLPLDVNKDTAVCLAGGPILSEKVIVGSNNGIQDVLVFLNTDLPRDPSGNDNPLWVHAMYDYAKVEAGEFEARFPQQSRRIDFDQDDCQFLTHLLVARSDQIVVLKNSDQVGHNTKFEPIKATGTNSQLGVGESKDHTLSKQEKQPFSVTCSVHGWMAAYMISRDNPYFCVSKNDGSFEIQNVPAGVKLEFRVWQEMAKFVDPGSYGTFTINGADTSAALGRNGVFELTLEEGKTYDIQATIDASAFPASVK